MFLKKIQKLHYKKLFLYGAYNTIIILTLIAFVIDSFLGVKEDAIIDILFGVLSFISYKLFCKRDNLNLAAIALFWISVFIEFLYLEVHSIDFNIIFAFFIPIIAYISMSKRLIIINLILFYILLISYLGYYYFHLKNNIFLHNSSYLVTYIMAHLFILSFGLFYNLAIEESIRRLEESNKIKNTLLHEVHHRVKNNLNLVASILGLNANMINSTTTKIFLESNQKRIESMAILHEILYKQDRANSADISDYIHKLLAHILKSVSQKDVEVKCNIEHVEFPMDSMIQFGIILNELITNSIKHKNRDNLKININFYHYNTYYCLEYCDSNITADKNKLKSGFGYNLINLAAKHFKADISIDNSNGLCYKFTLKRGW
jgi:two-component sensor histidine kinase